jgi:hypothetical protein
MRSMVEGQVQDFITSKGQEAWHGPLHQPAAGPPPRAGEVL